MMTQFQMFLLEPTAVWSSSGELCLMEYNTCSLYKAKCHTDILCAKYGLLYDVRCALLQYLYYSMGGSILSLLAVRGYAEPLEGYFRANILCKNEKNHVHESTYICCHIG